MMTYVANIENAVNGIVVAADTFPTIGKACDWGKHRWTFLESQNDVKYVLTVTSVWEPDHND